MSRKVGRVSLTRHPRTGRLTGTSDYWTYEYIRAALSRNWIPLNVTSAGHVGAVVAVIGEPIINKAIMRVQLRSRAGSSGCADRG